MNATEIARNFLARQSSLGMGEYLPHTQCAELCRAVLDAEAYRAKVEKLGRLRAGLPVESTVSPPRVQREAVRPPTHEPKLAPRLPTSEQQAPLPAERESAGDKP
jgi:hypothetical protein